MSMNGLPLARLKTDKGLALPFSWVVCASCGTRFAQRLRGSEEVLTRVFGAPLPESSAGVLRFLPGWGRRDGVWRMSRRAYRRQSQGRSPLMRRNPLPAVENPRHRMGNYSMPSRSNFSILPQVAICPACNLRQLLDPRALEASAAE